MTGLADLRGRLEAELSKLGSVGVALSGGVDSSLVVAAAVEVLGRGRVIALTAVSAACPPGEPQEAGRLAQELGVEYVIIEADELQRAAFAANTRERCYLCKRELFGSMLRVVGERGYAALADGTNRDDLDDDRPGLRAAAECGVMHPLLAAGLGKHEVRLLARHVGLRVWDAPSQACLASRIPYGEPVTVEKLRAVASAERELCSLGFERCRARHHGAVLRLEVDPAEVERAAALRGEIVRRLRPLGFRAVALDLEGVCTGGAGDTAPRRREGS